MRRQSIGLCISLVLAGGSAMAAGHVTLSPVEAKKRLTSDKTIILLDVRTPSEYAEKHIPGALLMPLDTIEQSAAKVLPDKKRTVFVYCRSGHRSRIASEKLTAMGYTGIFDIGGIISWPYETVSGRK